MDDLSVLYTDKKLQTVENKIHKEYLQAKKSISKKLDAFVKESSKKEKDLKKKLKNGTITEAEFYSWKAGQFLAEENLRSQLQNMVKVLSDTNTIATNFINNEKADVFAFSGNYTAYEFEHGFGMNFGFDLYNQKAVERLIKENPKILPKKKLDKTKDESWNMRNFRSQITQGILQGESIPKIAERLATVVPDRNEKQMILHARTAMTSAQNGGRQERYKEAQALGIKFKKVWLATLDGRTRDLHANLDGQAVNPDDDFEIDGYYIAYPGDPDAEPEMIYNCRCTMVTELDDYPSHFNRRVQESGEIIAHQTYNEWYIDKVSNDASASIKDLQKLQDKLQREIDKLDVKNNVFSGIWKNQDVTYANYNAKKDSIQGKKDYYENKLSELKGNGISSGTEYDFYTQKLQELEKFETNGKKYAEYTQKLKETNDKIIELRPPEETKVAGKWGPDAYTQDRLDNAVWAKSPREADNELREVSGKVWREATQDQREAIFEYTQSYHKFNEPLRGIEYGTEEFKGVGNTDLDAGRAHNGKMLNDMTDIISKSTYNEDIWLQRGVGFRGMDKFFDCDIDLLKYGTEEELKEQLLGKVVTEYGFMSCGSSKGQGFSGDMILNVYTPAGTQMMYVEPFSAFGDGDGFNWDGISSQDYFGSELETILQQGTQFTVEKIERSYGTIYVDLHVYDQSHVQRWEP